MNRTLGAALAAVSVFALSACNNHSATNTQAANAGSTASAKTVDGTWKADIDSVKFDVKPDELLLQNGVYSCKSCIPAFTVPADGAFHPVKLPYADSVAIKVVDDHSIQRTSKKNGKQVGESMSTVSSDGNMLTTKWTDTSTPGAAAQGETMATRVGPAPAGAHAISGQWKPAKLANFNAAALTFTIKVDGNTFHSSSPDGTSFDAPIGGADVPMKGDIAGTTVSVSKDGSNGYKVTQKRDGKVVGSTTYTIGDDGKLHGAWHNDQNGSSNSWTATRQS